jgi:hypothetical protein
MVTSPGLVELVLLFLAALRFCPEQAHQDAADMNKV